MVRIARLFGVDIKLDYSWFIILVLVVWSLGGHYFPVTHPGWSAGIYWTMGVVTALLYFGSVLAHELAHSLVSRAHGIPVRGITLFIFGGVAQISQEPKSARDELLMAIAGPVTSLAVAVLFGVLWLVAMPFSLPLHALTGWLAWINVGLALFNLIPGFPLDGGRILRALVWGITRDLSRATRLATGVGRVVAYGFMLWGIWQIFTGNWTNGLWISFIGWFLENAATQARQRMDLRDILAGHTARDVMMTDCPRIARGLPLDVLVDRVVIPGGRRCFPIMEDDEILGLLTLHVLKEVPVELWAATRVEEVMIPRGELKTVGPDDDLFDVFERMAIEDVNQLPVLEKGKLLGMVARNDVLAYLRTRAVLGM